MDATKLQTIVDDVHVATSIATSIIEAAGIGGNFNEDLLARGEDAAFGIVKAALTGYTKATGKTLTADDVTALLITDAPLEVDPALEAPAPATPPTPVVTENPVPPVEPAVPVTAEPPVAAQTGSEPPQ